MPILLSFTQHTDSVLCIHKYDRLTAAKFPANVFESDDAFV